jgi:hypothetical protein
MSFCKLQYTAEDTVERLTKRTQVARLNNTAVVQVPLAVFTPDCRSQIEGPTAFLQLGRDIDFLGSRTAVL